ncbi:MAG: c-type cytochrome [Holophagales bacterium]|nr:c-type cytochrome [Holophagales bacterium]
MSSTLRITSLSIALATGALISCATESDPGARLWRKNCAACHGEDGAGRTRFARGRPFADLTDGRWKHGSDRASVRRLVADGDPASTMPPFDGRLAPAEIDTVVDHALKLATPAPAGARP